MSEITCPPDLPCNISSKKNYVGVLILILLIFSAYGCARQIEEIASPESTSPVVPSSSPATPSISPSPSIPTRTPTKTIEPSSTHSPTLSPVPIRSDNCPTGREVSQVQDRGITFELGKTLDEPIGEYLNSGGTPSELVTTLRTLCGSEIAGAPAAPLLAEAILADVTGNGLGDVIVALTVPYGGGFGEAHVMAFVATDNGYEQHILFRRAGAGSAAEGLYEGGGPILLDIVDMNLNSTKEIPFAVRWSGYTEIYIAEWSGDSFHSLIRVYSPAEMVEVAYISASPASVFISDLEGNGTKELIIEEKVPGDLPIIPSRLRHQQIWAWDGKTFSLLSSSITTSPDYRIEAIIFGDLTWRIFHEPQLAIELYQQAVFDKSLQPGTPGKPDTLATDTENANEAERLAAFGRFRIMMVLAFMGDQNGAETVFNTMTIKFLPDSPGYPYLLMAREFWRTYEVQGSFHDGCQAAEGYAFEYSAEILDLLGPEYYGIEYVQDPAVETGCYGWLYLP